MSAQRPIKPLNVLDDAALMSKIQAGQSDKLGLLFERYHKRLYAFFVRLTRDSAMSEDLVQNTFFRVLKYKNSYDVNKRFSTWLYQVARNVFHDQYRKKSSKETSVDDFKQNEPIADEKDSFQEPDERMGLLKKALDQLSADKREILVLSKYEGLRYKEIGDILECSETAVKVKAHRAMKELKTIYLKLEKDLAV
ncbi:MAG: RNA polymerase sigma factor [Saprospiraceae bacterium]|nr:RNA polymerase sigma factor [Saprospiraceae bacterium]